MTRQEASLFFRLVSYRYGRGAMLITTNKSIRDWTELLAGAAVLASGPASARTGQQRAQPAQGQTGGQAEGGRWLGDAHRPVRGAPLCRASR